MKKILLSLYLAATQTICVAFPATTEKASNTVEGKVLVSEVGEILEVQITKSSGDAKIDQKASEAIKKAKAKPYMKNGKPERIWAPFKAHFAPDGLSSEVEN